MFGDGPLGREICGDEDGIRALPADDDPRLLADDVPAGEHRRRRSPATSATTRRSALAGDRVRDRQRRDPGLRRGADAARRRAVRCSAPGATRRQAQLVVGVPALRRDHPDAWILSVLNAVLGDGMSSRLFLSVREELGPRLRRLVGSRRLRRRRRARDLGRRRSRTRLPAALDAILAELARLRDEPVPAEELDKAKAYLSGGLELRMDETRHLASWIGGQEALHDRVLTLEEALAEVAAVDGGGRPAARRRAVPRRGPAARGRRPGPLRARPRAPPPAAGMTTGR